MHVLMISDVYFPRVNGVSTSIQTFARHFVTLGHRVTLLAPEYRRTPRVQGPTPEDFEIIRLPARYLPFDPEDRMLLWRPLLAITKQLREQDVDLVHIHTPFVAHYAGAAIARRLGVPVMESYHTFFEQYLDKYIPFLPARWIRAATRRFSAAQCNDVDAIAVPSRAMLEVLKDYGIRTSAEVVPTGIDLERFRRGDGERFRRQFDIPMDRPLLIHAGRLAFEKNCDFLLRMLRQVRDQIPEVLLVIAGDGPARKQLERLTRRLGLQDSVRFIGYLQRNGELEDFYAAGDAFVFASRTETQGLVLLESMALGTPLVSTAVMGTKEVLGPGCGALIAEDDERQFADCCVRLLTDPELRTEFAERGQTYVKDWSAPVMAKRMLALYARVIKG